MGVGDPESLLGSLPASFPESLPDHCPHPFPHPCFDPLPSSFPSSLALILSFIFSRFSRSILCLFPLSRVLEELEKLGIIIIKKVENKSGIKWEKRTAGREHLAGEKGSGTK